MSVPRHPLSAVESRRDVYFYRSHNDMLARKREYARKADKVENYQRQLAAVEQELADNKEEYKVILSESRDATCKEQFGLENLSRAKKLAMDAIKTTELKKRQLSSDIKSIEESIKAQAAHCSQGRICIHLEGVAAYICAIGKEEQWKHNGRKRGNNDSNKDLRVPILGVFDAHAAIPKSQKAVVKTFTVEEEAAKRKEEMRLLQTTSKELTKSTAPNAEGAAESLCTSPHTGIPASNGDDQGMDKPSSASHNLLNPHPTS